jgi:hypothetical protein
LNCQIISREDITWQIRIEQWEVLEENMGFTWRLGGQQNTCKGERDGIGCHHLEETTDEQMGKAEILVHAMVL